MVERPQNEWTVDALDRAHAAISFRAADSQTVRRGDFAKVWCKAVAACGEFAHVQFAVNRCSADAVLAVGGIIDGGQGTGMVYQNMLKTTSRADERHASLTGSRILASTASGFRYGLPAPTTIAAYESTRAPPSSALEGATRQPESPLHTRAAPNAGSSAGDAQA